MNKLNKNVLLIGEILLIAGILYLAGFVNKSNRKELHEFLESDVRHEMYQAREIVTGGNPYEKIHSGDLLNNKKYATLMPLYYYSLSLMAAHGNYDLEMFVDVFRIVLFLSEIAIAVFTYLMFRKAGNRWLGILAIIIFLFNRWTLRGVRDVKQDVFGLSFLISSLYFLQFEKSKWALRLSYLLFGISIGLKHVGIFLTPVYLLPFIYKRISYKETILNSLLFLLPTLGASIPMLVADPTGLIYSILISLTRSPNSANVEFGFTNTLVLYNVGVTNNSIIYYLLPRLPFFIALLISSILMFFRKMPVFLYTLTCMFIFIAFNPVLMNHYYIWVTAFLLFPYLPKYWFEKS